MIIYLIGVDGELLVIDYSSKKNGNNDGDTDENYGGPLVSLSEFCINVLSSPILR